MTTSYDAYYTQRRNLFDDMMNTKDSSMPSLCTKRVCHIKGIHQVNRVKLLSPFIAETS